jgi:hypothetical protein
LHNEDYVEHDPHPGKRFSSHESCTVFRACATKSSSAITHMPMPG